VNGQESCEEKMRKKSRNERQGCVDRNPTICVKPKNESSEQQKKKKIKERPASLAIQVDGLEVRRGEGEKVLWSGVLEGDAGRNGKGKRKLIERTAPWFERGGGEREKTKREL